MSRNQTTAVLANPESTNNQSSLLRVALVGVSTLIASQSSALAQDSAMYAFEYNSEWSKLTHPINFPSGNPHMTTTVGATHTDAISIWSDGGIATEGLEEVAERGTRTIINEEIQSLIDNSGQVDQLITLSRIPFSPGISNSSFSINADYPLLSLISMIAPSPDWFVGVHDVNLRPNGIWAREIVIDLYPYDSGTDSGSSYNSGNADVTPHEPISNISDSFPFIGTPRMGTFTFTLVSPAACSRADLAEPYEEFNFFDVSAFLSAFTADEPAADLNDDGEHNFFDVSDFLTLFSAGCP